MNIIPEIAAWLPELTAWRHHLHAHPEVGFEELQTSAFVADLLTRWGIEVHRNVGRTGVVGVLHGKAGSGKIGMRADMDALPIEEANSFAHRSTTPGTMHACGHDGHTTMLLGAARYLAVTREFSGSIHFIFQPAEEGQGGARAMLDDALFERFPCDAVFSLHNRPNIPLGHAVVNHGVMMAGASIFTINIRGVGGHGARPHLTVDPILVAGQLIQGLQSIVSRRIDPLEPAVVSLGSVHGGAAVNVIPECVELTGTVRCFDDRIMSQIETEVRQICKGVGLAGGATVEVEFNFVAPPVINDKREAELARRVLVAMLGVENVATDVPPAMGSEDFAHMLRARPGAYVFLGMREKRAIPMIHHPGYDFNDQLLPLGASYFVQLARARLI